MSELSSELIGTQEVKDENGNTEEVAVQVKDGDGNLKDATIGDILIGPDTIFCGKVDMLDANIFQAESSNGAFSGFNMVGTIKKAIAQTYVILRNICAMLMLAGLIYIGIRILIDSNNPQKQAQWKAYITDWLIGLILLIFSHILMYGIFYISDTITFILRNSMIGMGSLNLKLIVECFKSFEAAKQIICIVMLGYLIYLTVIFAIAYLKRLMWVCVLIVIAPIVSVMYAFGPSTKQIYTKWLKEYTTTVLVQPFHMIVYSVLISIPLNMTNSGGGYQLTMNSTFTMIYALAAISFIRPAEKYIRDLFGMGQGIANMASYDSGKQTVDAVVDVVKKVGAVAAVAATGGAAAPLVGSELGAAAGGMESMATVTEMDPDILASGVPREEIYGGASRDPLHDDYFAGDPNFDNDLQNPHLTGMDRMDEEELQNELDNLGLERGSEERSAMEDSYKEAGHGGFRHNKNIDEVSDSVEDSVGAAVMEMKGLAEVNKNDSELGNIKADNVNINAGKINIQGMDGSHSDDSTQSAEDDLNNERKAAGESDSNNDEKVNIKSQGNDEEENIREGFLLKDYMKVATGQKGIFEALSEQPKTKLGRGAKRIISKPGNAIHSIGENLEDTEGKGLGKSIKRGIGKTFTAPKKAFQYMKAFEKQGEMQKLHEGLNSIRDTFFVDRAPQDWKTTNGRMAEDLKERQEQQKYEFINKQENRDWLVIKYQNDLRNQYKDREKYPTERLREMAIEKANSKLKSLADTYVPLGLTDSKIAYECEEDRRMYGFTAKEAVQQRVNYEKFNVDSKNITYLNNKYNQDYSSVKEAVGNNTRDYYNHGYTDIGNMDLVRSLTSALNVSMERGMQLDQVLRRKGGQIDYEKANITNQQKAILKPIMDQYKDIQKGKK